MDQAKERAKMIEAFLAEAGIPSDTKKPIAKDDETLAREQSNLGHTLNAAQAVRLAYETLMPEITCIIEDGEPLELFREDFEAEAEARATNTSFMILEITRRGENAIENARILKAIHTFADSLLASLTVDGKVQKGRVPEFSKFGNHNGELDIARTDAGLVLSGTPMDLAAALAICASQSVTKEGRNLYYAARPLFLNILNALNHKPVIGFLHS